MYTSFGHFGTPHNTCFSLLAGSEWRGCSSFVVRCTVASVAFSPTGLTFKIAQLCMNGKQYPLPSGPNVTYFIFKGYRAQSDPLCNYDLLKMIPNYQWICGLVSGSKLRAVALYYSQNNFPWVDGLSTKIPVLRSQYKLIKGK